MVIQSLRDASVDPYANPPRSELTTYKNEDEDLLAWCISFTYAGYGDTIV